MRREKWETASTEEFCYEEKGKSRVAAKMRREIFSFVFILMEKITACYILLGKMHQQGKDFDIRGGRISGAVILNRSKGGIFDLH